MSADISMQLLTLPPFILLASQSMTPPRRRRGEKTFPKRTNRRLISAYLVSSTTVSGVSLSTLHCTVACFLTLLETNLLIVGWSH